MIMSRMETWRELDIKLDETQVFLTTYYAPWAIGLPVPYNLFAIKVVSNLDNLESTSLISDHLGIPFIEDPDAFNFQSSFLLPRRRDPNGNLITFALWLHNDQLAKFFDPKPIPISEDSPLKLNLLRKSTFSSLIKRSWMQWSDLKLRKTSYFVATSELGLIAKEDRKTGKEQARLYFDIVHQSKTAKVGGIVSLTSNSLVGYQAMRLEIEYQEIVIMGLLHHILAEEHDMEGYDLRQINTFGLRFGTQLTQTLPLLKPKIDPYTAQNLLYSAVIQFDQSNVKVRGIDGII